MKKLVTIASAISLLTFGAAASAEQQLSLAEMEGVTAAGFADVLADARARGVEAFTATDTFAFTRTVDELIVSGQVGRINVVQTDGFAESCAFARGSFAEADGFSLGFTEGTLNSDVVETSFADADTTGTLVPGSKISAYSENFGYADASEIIIGRAATANNTSASFAVIGN